MMSLWEGNYVLREEGNQVYTWWRKIKLLLSGRESCCLCITKNRAPIGCESYSHMAMSLWDSY